MTKTNSTPKQFRLENSLDATEHSHTLVKINSLKIIEKMVKEKEQNKLIEDMFMAP